MQVAEGTALRAYCQARGLWPAGLDPPPPPPLPLPAPAQAASSTAAGVINGAVTADKPRTLPDERVRHTLEVLTSIEGVSKPGAC
jgi:hypothetical protein